MKPTPPGTTEPTEFYARFTLDSVRSIRQFGDIVEHVAGQLGADVEFTVELNAKKAEGFDDRTRRVVSENAANLGAENTEFGSSSTPESPFVEPWSEFRGAYKPLCCCFGR